MPPSRPLKPEKRSSRGTRGLPSAALQNSALSSKRVGSQSITMLVNRFYRSVAEARAHCSDIEFRAQLDMITSTRAILRDHLDDWRHTELDPAVSTLVSISSSWSDQCGESFSIVHDRSKAIAFEQDFVESLMDPSGPDERVGRDRRTAPLFIKGSCSPHRHHRLSLPRGRRR